MLKESVEDGRSSNILLANCLKLRCTQRQALIAHVQQFVYVHVHVMHMYMHISHVVYMYITCSVHVYHMYCTYTCMYITCSVHVCVIFD